MRASDIQRAVAAYYRLSVDDLIGPSVKRSITGPRQEAVWLVSTELGFSLPQIGRLFGGRDHTTILYAKRAVEARIAKDPKLAKHLAKLAEKSRNCSTIEGGAWSEEELAILRAVYPKKGSKGVCRILTHRTLQSVWAKVRKLGITYERIEFPKIEFPRECKQCGTALHYSKSPKYLSKKPTGLCRACCNRRPRSPETIKRLSEATRRAFTEHPEFRIKQRDALREAMARISPKERERRREAGRTVGKSNKGNQNNPAGSPCRVLAGKRASETRRKKLEAMLAAERARPKTFEEKLALVLAGKAQVIPAFKPSNDPEYTLGGVSAGMVA